LNKILHLNTRCLLSYCHRILIEAEKLLQDGIGKVVIDNANDRENVREIGLSFIKFCEDNNCTREFLETKIIPAYFINAKKHYGNIIRVYNKFFDGRHIPLLFAIIVFQRLSVEKTINFDISELQNSIKIFMKSNHLGKDEIKSFMGGTRIKNTEVILYQDCVDSIFNVLNKKNSVSRKINKKKRK